MKKGRATSKPLREQPSHKVRLLKPGSPREEWVIERPDGWVLRRRVPLSERAEYSPGTLTSGGWWQSSLTTIGVVRMAAERCDASYMICAVRRNADTGEEHIAPVSRERLKELS